MPSRLDWLIPAVETVDFLAAISNSELFWIFLLCS